MASFSIWLSLVRSIVWVSLPGRLAHRGKRFSLRIFATDWGHFVQIANLLKL
jgi:hypothetical protein